MFSASFSCHFMGPKGLTVIFLGLECQPTLSCAVFQNIVKHNHDDRTPPTWLIVPWPMHLLDQSEQLDG